MVEVGAVAPEQRTAVGTDSWWIEVARSGGGEASHGVKMHDRHREIEQTQLDLRDVVRLRCVGRDEGVQRCSERCRAHRRCSRRVTSPSRQLRLLLCRLRDQRSGDGDRFVIVIVVRVCVVNARGEAKS